MDHLYEVFSCRNTTRELEEELIKAGFRKRRNAALPTYDAIGVVVEVQKDGEHAVEGVPHSCYFKIRLSRQRLDQYVQEHPLFGFCGGLYEMCAHGKGENVGPRHPISSYVRKK
jgi:hypothetical protein